MLENHLIRRIWDFERLGRNYKSSHRVQLLATNKHCSAWLKLDVMLDGRVSCGPNTARGRQFAVILKPEQFG